MMRNPPLALLLSMPLGWVQPRIGLLLWTAAALGCVIGSVHALDVAPQDRIFCYLFAPVFACFVLGQTSPFLLLGFCLFVRFHRSNPLAAGAALLLMAIKRHLFLAFWPILLIDCLYRRRYRLLAGGAVAAGVASLCVLYLDPQVWHHWAAMLRAEHIDTEFLPVPALLFRYAIAPSMAWLQFLPSCAAIAWGIWFYARRRHSWDWGVDGVLIMAVTVFASPYAWTTDEIVLVPAVMAVFAQAIKPRFSVAAFVVLNAVEMLLLALQVHTNTLAYVWTSTAWLAWYVYSSRPEKAVVHGVEHPLSAPAV